ncbi:MAG: hypothetical protein LBG52_01230 [Candidatus Peribacteria bacterium]|nr:hypothetical protein [Candidatus Peribacteria bacterium]
MPTYTSRETYDFISKQTNDPIVGWRTCKVSGQPFPRRHPDQRHLERNAYRTPKTEIEWE